MIPVTLVVAVIVNCRNPMDIALVLGEPRKSVCLCACINVF